MLRCLFMDYKIKTPIYMKWCSKCKDYHPEEMFYKQPSRSDGLSAYCIEQTKKAVDERKKKKQKEREQNKFFSII